MRNFAALRSGQSRLWSCVCMCLHLLCIGVGLRNCRTEAPPGLRTAAAEASDLAALLSLLCADRNPVPAIRAR